MKTIIGMTVLALFVLSMSMPGSAYAITDSDMPGWNNLSKVEQAQLKLQSAQAAEKAASIPKPPVSVEEVQKWVNIGKNIGVGFGAAANELGVGVDALMHSDTGKIAMFLIVYNYIGDALLGIIFGSIWFLVALPSWAYYMRRWLMVPTWEWHENGKKKSFTYKKSTSGDAIIYFTVVLVAILVIGFIIMF